MEDEDSIASTLEQVKTLNKGLEALKDMLIKYLSDIDYKTIKKNDAINTHFAQEFDQEWKSSQHNQAMLLNFNYTTTIDLYAHQFEGRCAYNFIHGLLNDKSNPIIFGYGDEMDSYYEKIAEFNNNDFLKHFKSFEYSKTDNYQKILPFLESFEYEVLIMGHSCGLSDRVLLNGVFEHQNCRSIKIYYYQKPDGTNDYDEKVREISRHFSANNRNRMRNLIVPFSKSSPLS